MTELTNPVQTMAENDEYDGGLKREYRKLLASLNESLKAIQYFDNWRWNKRIDAWESDQVRCNKYPEMIVPVQLDDIQLMNALSDDSLQFHLRRLLLTHRISDEPSIDQASLLSLVDSSHDVKSLLPTAKDTDLIDSTLNFLTSLFDTTESTSCDHVLNSVLSFLDVQKSFRLIVDSDKNVVYMKLLDLKQKYNSNAETRSLIDTCLLKLAVAFGSQELLLMTAVQLLSPLFGDQQKLVVPLSSNLMSIPESYLQLERCLIKALFGVYDWVDAGITEDLEMFAVDLPKIDQQSVVSFAVDACFIYLLYPDSLYKIGSGFGGSLAGYEYLSSRVPSDTCKKVFCHNGNLYIECATAVMKLNTETLKVEEQVAIESLILDNASHLACDGTNLRFVYVDEDGQLHASELGDHMEIVKDDTYSSEKMFICFGQTVCLTPIKADDKFVVEPTDVVDVVASDRSMFVLTKRGRVLFANAMESACCEIAWHFVPLSARFKNISVNREETFALFTADDGSCFLAGSLANELANADANINRLFVHESTTDIGCLSQCIRLSKNIRLSACSDDRICLITCDDDLCVFDNRHRKFYGSSAGLQNDDGFKEMFLCDSQLLIKTEQGHLLTVDTERLLSTTVVDHQLVCMINGTCSPISFTPFCAQVVEQVSCGQSHVVMVTDSATLLTFGNNHDGQLGVGSLGPVSGIQFPAIDPSLRVKTAAAGYNHTVVLMNDGSVYTFGEFGHGQLGRLEGADPLWHAIPGKIKLLEEYCIVRKVMAFADSTILVVESTDVPWLDADAQLCVFCNENGCFLTSAKHGVKNSSYFVMSSSKRSVEQRQDPPSASTLSHICCFDIYNALWRLDMTQHRLLCFLPRTMRNCDDSKENRFVICADSATFLPFHSNRASPYTVGMSILQTVDYVLENSKQLSRRWTRRTGSDSCFDRCYRVPLCNSFTKRTYRYCSDSSGNEGVEFTADRDVMFLGLSLLPAEQPCKASLTIMLRNANDNLTKPVRYLTFEYWCVNDGDMFDVVFDRPVFCPKGRWCRISVELTALYGTSTDDRFQEASGEDGTMFQFRNGEQQFDDLEYIQIQAVSQLFYIPAYLWDDLEGMPFQRLCNFCHLSFEQDVMLDMWCSSLTTDSSQTVASLFIEASTLVLRTKNGSVLRGEMLEACCKTCLLCLSILHRFLFRYQEEYRNDREDGDVCISVVPDWVPKVLQVIHGFSALENNNNLEALSAKSFVHLKTELFAFVGKYFHVFFDHDVSAGLIRRFAQMESYNGPDLISFIIGFARSNDYLKTLCKRSIGDEAQFDLCALFQLVSMLTVRLDEGGWSTTAVERHAVEFIFQVLRQAALATREMRSVSGLYRVCRFKYPKAVSCLDATLVHDAVTFTTDRDIVLHGFGIYTMEGCEDCEVKLYVARSSSDGSPLRLTTDVGTIEYVDELLNVYFRVPVYVCKDLQHTLIFSCCSSGCYSGRSGRSVVRGDDGCRFTFSQRKYSKIGISTKEGLFPFMYYSAVSGDVCDSSNWNWNTVELRRQFWQWAGRFLASLRSKIESSSSSTFRKSFTCLCARVMPLISVFIETDASEMKNFLSGFDDLLLSLRKRERKARATELVGLRSDADLFARVVESDHPYIPCSIKKFYVTSSQDTDFMAVEFDDRCHTRQSQDSLIITVKSYGGESIFVGPFSGTSFPTYALFLPGNCLELTFSTAAQQAEETGSKLECPSAVHDEDFGFRCFVRAVKIADEEDVLDWLEKQVTAVLSYGVSAFFWHANYLNLKVRLWQKQEETQNSVEVSSQEESCDSAMPLKSLIRTGIKAPNELRFEHILKETRLFREPYTADWFIPTILQQPLTNSLNLFEFNRWLVDKPFIDPLYTRLESSATKNGAVFLSLALMDQYQRKIFLPKLDVRIVAAVVVGDSSFYDSADPHPSFQKLITSFQPSCKGRSMFHCVSMQPGIDGLSLEELRLLHIGDGVCTFPLRLHSSDGHLYVGSFKTLPDGVYDLCCFIDGFELRLLSPHFLLISGQSSSAILRDICIDPERYDSPRMAVCLSMPPNSVAIRSSPCKSDMNVIGYVPSFGFFFSTERVWNTEGCWIRVPLECVPHYFDSQPADNTCGWCLQYDADSRRTDFVLCEPLVVDSEEAGRHYAVQCIEDYCLLEEKVVIRSKPTFQAPVIGYVQAREADDRPGSLRCCTWEFNDQGVWVTIDLLDDTNKDLVSLSLSSSDGSLFGYCCVVDREFRIHMRCAISSCERAVPRSSRNERYYGEVLLPSDLSSSSSVFAAFLHKKELEDDFRACLLYLRFHPHLWSVDWSESLSRDGNCSLKPLALFRQIFCKVQSTIAVGGDSYKRGKIPADRKDDKESTEKRARRTTGCASGVDCELCHETFRTDFLYHMARVHPGCGCSTRFVYVNSGKYVECYLGREVYECGIQEKVDYALCLHCRERYLKTNPPSSCCTKEMVEESHSPSDLAILRFPRFDFRHTVRFVSGMISAADVEHNEVYVTNQSLSPMGKSNGDDLSVEAPSEWAAEERLLPTLYQKLSQEYDHTVEDRFICPSTFMKMVMAFDDGQVNSTVCDFTRSLLGACFDIDNESRLVNALCLSPYTGALYECGYKCFLWLLNTASYKHVVLTQLNVLLTDYGNKPWRRLLAVDQFEFLCADQRARLTALQWTLLDSVMNILRSDDCNPQTRRLCCRFAFSKLFVSQPEAVFMKGVLKFALSCLLMDTKVEEGEERARMQDEFRRSSTISYEVVESEDLSKFFNVFTSSSKDLAHYLLDGQMNTFWVSDKSDFCSWKQICVQWPDCPPGYDLELFLYIDNKRQDNTEVTSVVVLGKRGSTAFSLLMTRSIEPSFVGWVRVSVTGFTEARVRLHGDHQCVLLSLVRLVGMPSVRSKFSKPNQDIPKSVSLLRKDVLSYCSAACDHFLLNTNGDVKISIQVKEAIVQDILSVLKNVTKNLRLRPVSCDGQPFSDLLTVVGKVLKSDCARTILELDKKFMLSLSTLVLLGGDQAVQTCAVQLLAECFGICPSFDGEGFQFGEDLLRTFAKVFVVKCTAEPNRTFTVGNCLSEAEGWYVDRTGCTSTELASRLVEFLQNLKSGEHGSAVAAVIDTTITNSLQLSTLRDLVLQQTPFEVVAKKPELWLFFASLFFLSAGDAVKLFDQQDSDNRTSRDAPQLAVEHRSVCKLCAERSGGTSPANIYCITCRTYLCSSCSSVIHGAVGGSTTHEFRQELGMASSQIVVRKSYIRLKLENLVLVIDKNNYNVLLNLRSADSSLREECNVSELKFCHKLLACGHLCGGVKGETSCLPCLSCASVSSLGPDKDDACMICFWQLLDASPSIQLVCGHVFHYHCCQKVLKEKWHGSRISFDFMSCPLCRQLMDHPLLHDRIKSFKSLQTEIEQKALKRLEFEGLNRCSEITDPNSKFYNNPVAFAMSKFSYFQCYKCHRPYFGGAADCQTIDFDPAQLVCGGCSNLAGASVCPKHGTEYLEYKCRYCCSVATVFCFGTTHSCGKCHEQIYRFRATNISQLPQCPTGPLGQCISSCPLKIRHPPTGIEFALGCSLCRLTKDF